MAVLRCGPPRRRRWCYTDNQVSAATTIASTPVFSVGCKTYAHGSPPLCMITAADLKYRTSGAG